MGASEYTKELGLPQFHDRDKPTWRGDINGAFQILDRQYGGRGEYVVPDANHWTLTEAIAEHPDKVIVASGQYETDQTLVIPVNADLSGLTIYYTGTGDAVQYGKPDGKMYANHVKMPRVIHKGKPMNGWDAIAGSVGIRFTNAYACLIEIPYVRGFERGVVFEGVKNNGSQQNSIMLGHLDNNKCNLEFNGDATGWSNQNNFFGGRMSHNSNEGVQTPGVTHIRFVKLPNSVNNNCFFGTSLESPKVVEYHVASYSGSYNYFYGCRWENSGGDAMRRNLSDGISRGNVLFGGIYSESVQTVMTNGGWPFLAQTGAYQTMNTQTSKPTLWLENLQSTANPVFVITAPGGMEDSTKSPANDFTVSLASNFLKGKRANDPVGSERVNLDFLNGKISVSGGSTTPFSIQGIGSGLGLMADGNVFGAMTDGGADIGGKSSYRPGMVRAKTALVTGSGVSANRPDPAALGAGGVWFDLTLARPIWSTGSRWVDSSGQPV